MFIKDFTVHISDNKKLPSYENREFKKNKSRLEFVKDMYDGRDAWYSINDQGFGVTDPLKAYRYLPQEAEEPGDEYMKRLSRSYFERFFRNTIDNFSGFLTSFTVNDDVHPTIKSSIKNVDRLGNTLEVFLQNADVKALRDDRCFILVEFPKKDPRIQTALDERLYPTSPYLVMIDTRNVINWKIDTNNNNFIKRITIREEVTVDDDEYGEETIYRYRVLTPGNYNVYEIQGKKGEEFTVLVDSGTTSLDFVPIVPYCLTNTDGNNFTGIPPLYDLAELNLKHYQKSSEKDEVMHRCNLPVLVINEGQKPMRQKDGKHPVVSLGPNTCLWNVQAQFVEPSGSSIAQTQADIEKLENSIRERTLSFLTGSFVQRTATEVSIHAAPIKANLASMASAKNSAVETIFKYWAKYYNSDNGGTISVDEKILNSPMATDIANLLLTIMQDGNITLKSFLSILKDGKILPSSFDIKEELEEIEKKKEDEKKSLALEVKDFGMMPQNPMNPNQNGMMNPNQDGMMNPNQQNLMNPNQQNLMNPNQQNPMNPNQNGMMNPNQVNPQNAKENSQG